MLKIKTFTFNPFQENTYLLYNEQNEAILIDPGCYEEYEKQELSQFLEDNNIEIKLLLNTHCHVDHVLGNNFIEQKYGLITRMHELELPIFRAVASYASNYGFVYQAASESTDYLLDFEQINFGDDTLEVLFCPGHSPGSVCFYNAKQNFLIAGDVLFYRSIGRTDLPGGDHATLIRSIKNRLMNLPSETLVYSGHGPSTTIGAEKQYNPFINS
jgi:glyoxylase-like metal-dependent hydrolase (beta-lactamase superfamily II)